MRLTKQRALEICRDWWGVAGETSEKERTGEMTDAEKIDKLAAFMGWQLFESNGFKWWATLKGEKAAPIGWNPLINIAHT